MCACKIFYRDYNEPVEAQPVFACSAFWLRFTSNHWCTGKLAQAGHLFATLGRPFRALSCLTARKYGPKTPNHGLVNHLNAIFLNRGKKG